MGYDGDEDPEKFYFSGYIKLIATVLPNPFCYTAVRTLTLWAQKDTIYERDARVESAVSSRLNALS